MIANHLSDLEAPAPALPIPIDAAGHERDALGVEGVRMAFARGEEIYGAEDPAGYVYRVLRGVVRTCRASSDGRRRISDFYLAGDLFGLEAGGDHASSAEAATNAEVFIMRRRPLLVCAQTDCALAGRLWAATLEELRRSREHLLFLGSRSAVERVAWFLVDMAARGRCTGVVVLPAPREDIADYLDLTVETVTRAMIELESAGLVARSGGRKVCLSNRRALEAIAAV